ncbi:MAG: hypothetical protein JSR50_06675 [Proteobacteria bacterium]|nr:hypothetical protein [Pseudomonadota bacterium]
MRKQLFLRPAIATTLLLSIPLAMTAIDHNRPSGQGWHWGVMDFVVMGALLLTAGTTYELLSAKASNKTQQVALGLLIAAIVLAIWVELAVGGISQLVGWVTT